MPNIGPAELLLIMVGVPLLLAALLVFAFRRRRR